MIEIICTILGLIQGILAYLNKRSSWIVYAIQMLFLTIFSYINSLYGDMGQNFIYMFICIFSFYLWNPNSSYKQITHTTLLTNIIIVFSTICSTLFIGYALSKTDDPLPYIDAFTTVTTVIALLLMMFHKIETWIVWFINDIMYIYEYYALPNQAFYLIFLYIIWTGLAIGSFFNWLKIYKNEKTIS